VAGIDGKRLQRALRGAIEDLDRRGDESFQGLLAGGEVRGADAQLS
jgi:hypothetical protein